MAMRIASGPRSLLSAAVSVIVGAAVVAACAPVEEPAIGSPGNILRQHTPGGTTTDTDGGGTTTTAACTDANVVSDANCAVKFTADIFPLIKGTWGCTTAGCHKTANGQNATPPEISDADATAAYGTLKGWKGNKLTKVYVNPCSKDDNASAILGNLNGDLLPSMPPAGKPATGLDKLKTWVECGAPL
jgi:hypothetical protein